jgi:hypothetical protein
MTVAMLMHNTLQVSQRQGAARHEPLPSLRAQRQAAGGSGR